MTSPAVPRALSLQLLNLSKTFGARTLFRDLSLELAPGEIFCLVGPSGAGKSTLLRLVAGLESLDRGQVLFDGRPAGGPRHRPEALLMYQDHQLFPHLNVFENLAFGLRARRRPRTELRDQVEAMAAQLGLSERLHAYPAQLSGGEKQRCALGRALVLDPPWLLLDEPFASLDPPRKRETALFLGATARARGLGLLVVTHDFEQAWTLADRVGVLLDGALVQVDRPEVLRRQPADARVAAFFESQGECV